MSVKPVIRAFFDEATNTVSYLVADPETRRAAVIDPVLITIRNRARSRSFGRRCSSPLHGQTGTPSSGRSRPTRMPTICLVRPT